jgi:arylformamidase
MNEHTPAWYEAQYNNRALIPEHPAIFERWNGESQSVRERLADRAVLDVPYNDAGQTDPTQQLDIFRPEPALSSSPSSPSSPAPVLVFIHGGYWRSLDKHDLEFVAGPFVDAGALVVVPNYTLCPTVTIDQIVMQMVDAVAWTWRHAAEYGGDASRMVVAGHSAGGHLAAMLMNCRWREVAPDLPANLVSRAMSISGVFDLEPLRHAEFLAPDLRLTEAAAAKLSPAWMPAPTGKLVAVVGANETDEFRRQNRLIREQWGVGAVPVCEDVAERHHLDILDDLVDPGKRLHRQALDLLELAWA